MIQTGSIYGTEVIPKDIFLRNVDFCKLIIISVYKILALVRDEDMNV